MCSVYAPLSSDVITQVLVTTTATATGATKLLGHAVYDDNLYGFSVWSVPS